MENIIVKEEGDREILSFVDTLGVTHIIPVFSDTERLWDLTLEEIETLLTAISDEPFGLTRTALEIVQRNKSHASRLRGAAGFGNVHNP